MGLILFFFTTSICTADEFKGIWVTHPKSTNMFVFGENSEFTPYTNLGSGGVIAKRPASYRFEGDQLEVISGGAVILRCKVQFTAKDIVVFPSCNTKFATKIVRVPSIDAARKMSSLK